MVSLPKSVSFIALCAHRPGAERGCCRNPLVGFDSNRRYADFRDFCYTAGCPGTGDCCHGFLVVAALTVAVEPSRTGFLWIVDCLWKKAG